MDTPQIGNRLRVALNSGQDVWGRLIFFVHSHVGINSGYAVKLDRNYPVINLKKEDIVTVSTSQLVEFTT